LKLLPSSTATTQSFKSGYDTDDELEFNFAGTATYSCAAELISNWILDTGATDHMTQAADHVVNQQQHVAQSFINMPNGTKAMATCS